MAKSMMKFKVAGFEKLRKNLREIRKEIRKATEEAVEENGTKIYDDVRSDIPKLERELEQSVRIVIGETKKGGIHATIIEGNNEDLIHGPFLEFGTSEMPAQPHMRPAFDRNAPKFRRNIRKKVKVIIDKARPVK